MPQQSLDEMIREEAARQLEERKKQTGGKNKPPPAPADKPTVGPSLVPKTDDTSPITVPLDQAIQQAGRDITEQRRQAAGASPFNRWGWVYQPEIDIAKGARAGAYHTAMNLGDMDAWMQDYVQRQLANRSPVYRKWLEEEQKRRQAGGPWADPRKMGGPAYFGQDPELERRATPPPGWAGTLGYTGEQMAEQWGAGEVMPVIRGAGLWPAALRAGEQALAGGGMTGVQTGSLPEAEKGAAFGAAGAVGGELAGSKAAKKIQEYLPWDKDVSLSLRRAASERAVERGAVVPITLAEEAAKYPHLEPEIRHFKGIVDDITKNVPATAQRTIPIDDVLAPVNKMIAEARRSDRTIARYLTRKRDEWLEDLGYKPAVPAVAATPPQVVQVPLVQNGMLQFDKFGRPVFTTKTIPGKPGTPAVPAVTHVTVAEVQRFKESFNTTMPASAFGEGERGAAMQEAKLATREAAKAEIEKAVPERFKAFGNRTVAEMNRIIEKDLRLREAITDALKRKQQPQSYKGMLVALGLEAGAGAAAAMLWGPGKEHRENVAEVSAALMAGTILQRAMKNPLRMAKTMVWLRDSGVAIPATGYAAWRSLTGEPTGPAAPETSGGGRGGTQPERPRGGVGGGVAGVAPPRLTPEISGLLAKASRDHGVPLELLTHVAGKETAGSLSERAGAVSNKGAVGVMQITPDTATTYKADPAKLTDPAYNVNLSGVILSDLLKRYHGDWKLALAAYNAGPGAVEKYKGVPPYRETQQYVQGVR